MTRTLKDVLHEYAVQQRERAEELRRERQEWVDAVTQLLRQLEGWLREADTEGVLTFVPTTFTLAEPTLGRYEVPGLIVRLHNREVVIRPGGRDVYGTFNGNLKVRGSVNLTDGGVTYKLLRGQDQQGERWVLRLQSGDMEPLSREAFERVMVGIFG